MSPEYTPVEKAWYAAYTTLLNINRSIGNYRKIVITPFAGAYADPAGYVICMEGTPPYAIQIVLIRGADDHKMTIVDTYQVVRVKSPSYWNDKSNSRHKRLWDATLAILAERDLST